MGCNVMLPPNAMDAATDRLNLQSGIHAEGVPLPDSFVNTGRLALRLPGTNPSVAECIAEITGQ